MASLLRDTTPVPDGLEAIPVFAGEKTRAVLGHLGDIAIHGLEHLGRGIGAVEDAVNSVQQTVFSAAEHYIADQADELETLHKTHRPRRFGAYEYVDVVSKNNRRSIMFGRDGFFKHKLIQVEVNTDKSDESSSQIQAFEVPRTDDRRKDLAEVTQIYGREKKSGLSLFKVARAVRAAKQFQRHYLSSKVPPSETEEWLGQKSK